MSALIIGCGESDVGLVPNRSALELYVDCILAAVADAGLQLDDIDGLITMNSRTDPYLYHAEYLAEYLGIHPKLSYTLQTGGGTTISAVRQAASVIDAGHVRTVVVAAADNIRTGMPTSAAMASMASGAGHPDYDAPYGPTVPALYALMAAKHMHEYGTTREQMASVAVAMRRHAERNPKAQERKPIDVADVLGARMIAEPFGKLDCSLISDGGGAVVLGATSDWQSDRRSIEILGAAEAHHYLHIAQAESLTSTAAAESGSAAYRQARLSADDIDVAFIYDAFTILPIMFLEDLGFCAKGDGGAFVAEGNIELGGSLPVNPHGGLLSYCHPGRSGSMFMLTEAVRQLRGEAGQCQVEGATVALVHAEGGVASANGTLLLGATQ
jgi:acetyl-CoA acetyltransferase